MKARNLCLIIILGIILCAVVDGGRGGGGRGGGSRGGSSRGSSSSGSRNRGSTSSTSSQSSRTNYDRKSSGDSSESKPKVTIPSPKPPPEPARVKPSAPDLKETGPGPSAPRAPDQPAHNPNYPPSSGGQPGGQRQPAQNPNYGTGSQPGVNQPPPYPGGAGSQNLGNPPPYSGPGSGQNLGNPPPYPGPGQARPPAYDTQPLPPGPGFKPGVGNPPYPQQPGTGVQPYPRQPGAPYPQQPGTGGAPYPQQPGSVNQPYPQQPGSYPRQPGAPYPQQPGAPYPQQPGTGNYPYPRQPGAPYPQQPGMGNYPYPRQPGGGMYGNAPPYAQHSGFPMGGDAYAKPYKKKGLLGQVFSMGKTPKAPKHGSFGAGYGGYGGGHGGYGGGHGGMNKAMYPMMPLMMAKKPTFGSSFRTPSFMFLPIFMPSFGHHHHYGYYNHDLDNAQYRGRCRKPFKPNNSSMDCDTTSQRASCKVQCVEDYHFPDNTTDKTHECWHVSGVWRPERNFPECQPTCKLECQNGGKCVRPDVCGCDPEYRGEKCEHHVLKCDVRKLAAENSNKIGWVCHHTKNETTCQVRCRTGHFAKEPQSREYHCKINGEWTPNVIPDCLTVSDDDDGKNSTMPTTVAT